MSVPTDGQLRALRVIELLEQGQSRILNRGDAEECENEGWAEAQPRGGYRLTEEGRRILEADVNEVGED